MRRVIGLPHATAMVVGTIIGASIFVQPSEITGQVPSIGGVLSVWLCAGFLTFVGAMVCAELAGKFTESGGVYVYLREAFSPSLGFLWGWAMFWCMHSGIIAAIAMVFARYTAFFLPVGEKGIKIIAVSVILVLSAVNYVGVKHGSILQTLFTLGKVLAVLLIIVLGFAFGSRLPDHFVASSSTPPASISDFLTAMIAGLFAFGGWHMVTYSAEETVKPDTTIPRALLIGTIIVTACYIGMNTVYLYVLPLDTVANSTRVAADAADVLLGSGGGALMSAIVMFSTFGAVSGIILVGPRVYYSMARDGLLFRWVADIHAKYRTPHRAIVLQAVWSAVLVATGTYRVLFTRVIYTEWFFFALMAVGLLILRRRGELGARVAPFRSSLLPLIFSIASLAIVGNQIVSDPIESAIGLSLVLAGFPEYFIWARSSYSREEKQ
jgi:APA family basic amino acid/polyamine antiporter